MGNGFTPRNKVAVKYFLAIVSTNRCWEGKALYSLADSLRALVERRVAWELLEISDEYLVDSVVDICEADSWKSDRPWGESEFGLNNASSYKLCICRKQQQSVDTVLKE